MSQENPYKWRHLHVLSTSCLQYSGTYAGALELLPLPHPAQMELRRWVSLSPELRTRVIAPVDSRGSQR